MEEVGKEEGLLEQHQAMTWEDQSSPPALDFHICEMDSWSPVHAPFARPHFSVLTWRRILVWICKHELNPCFISWGSVISSTPSNPATLQVTLVANILCSWWVKWGVPFNPQPMPISHTLSLSPFYRWENIFNSLSDQPLQHTGPQ